MAAYTWLVAVALCLCTYNMGASAMSRGNVFGMRAFGFSADQQRRMLDKINNAVLPRGGTLIDHCRESGEKNVAARTKRKGRRNPKRTTRKRTAARALNRFSHRSLFSLTGNRYRDTIQCREQSFYYEGAIRALVRLTKLTLVEIRFLLSLPRVPPRLLGSLAIEALEVILQIQSAFIPQAPKITCPKRTLFIRTADGTCNNLMYPQFGMANAPLERFLPPMYEDGVGAPRITSDGTIPLPNPRDVSIGLHRADMNGGPPDVDDRITHMVMQWGQFMDHDLTLVPVEGAEEENNGENAEQEPEPIACCFEDTEEFLSANLPLAEVKAINLEIAEEEPSCIPFTLDPENDPAFQPRTCHSLLRSVEAIVPHFSKGRCGHTEREQMNVLTSFVDGSNVYGSSEEELLLLRTFEDGLLKSDEADGQVLLPPRPEELECIVENVPRCFLAGDERPNEQPGLGSIHTILLREHNRIARILLRSASRTVRRSYRTRRDLDEAVFQATRRIVIAIIQRITFGEFLPVLLDKDILCQCGLLFAHENTFFTGYNPRVNPGVRNSFSAAAYRLGHTMIREEFSVTNSRLQVVSSFNLSTTFEDESTTREFLPNGIIAGVFTDPAEMFDKLGSGAVTDRLFQNLDSQGIGMDLFSINIQRGRDHGLPPYVAFRKFCGLTVPTDFDELIDHPEETREALADVYSETGVGGIDLWTGGISESPKGSGLLGPTFACIVGKQFKNLKMGDRFYFETDDMNTGFNIDQLNNIRKSASLANLLCRNTDIREVSLSPFFLTDLPSGREGRVPTIDLEGKLVYVRNRRIKCRNTRRLPDIDFSLFPLEAARTY